MNKQIEALAMKLLLAKNKCKARQTCDGCNYSNINDAKLCEALLMAEELLKYYRPIDEISETAIKNSRKKTAEKFAERLKTECYDGGIDSKLVIVSFSRLDEIAKEIMEGK